MAQTYHPQSEFHSRIKTLTVGDLIQRLQALDPALPVIFESPALGSFGPQSCYTVDSVAAEVREREETTHPGGARLNEETGEDETYEPDTQAWKRWEGVVIR